MHTVCGQQLYRIRSPNRDSPQQITVFFFSRGRGRSSGRFSRLQQSCFCSFCSVIFRTRKLQFREKHHCAGIVGAPLHNHSVLDSNHHKNLPPLFSSHIGLFLCNLPHDIINLIDFRAVWAVLRVDCAVRLQHRRQSTDCLSCKTFFHNHKIII